MTTLLIVVVYFIVNIAMVISNKSNFKVLFSFSTSLIIFIFLNNLNYEYADIYLTFVTLMNFIALSYVKFSQTGLVRVLPSNRNKSINNMIPIVSVFVASVMVIILLNNVSDEILEKNILLIGEMTQNYFSDFNLVFMSASATLVSIIYLIRRVRE
ncbi:hypothetical protein [Halobacteriovorax marinus]|uniref:hypothetical protein n=1 Tax=Halobacteriovorax marinus TaxID=97084 RepID=UPI003A956C80